MEMLIGGVILWSATHLFPAVFPGARENLQEKLGENPYKGIFSLIILGSLTLIVFGWKAAVPTALYGPPLAASPVISALVLIGFVLFFASPVPGNIRRFVRHPQMSGTMLWGIAHLLANGDSRSIVLFGGMTIWALAEKLMINRRDGQWQRQAPAPIRFDLITVAIGVTAFAALLYFHATLFGASPIPVS